MSNFDGVINKAKSFINVAGKKTGEVVEVTKLKMEKLNKEAELQKKYELLGKICYANLKSKDVESGKMKNIIEEIDALDKNIKGITERILNMKDIRVCTKCGNRNDKKSIYCSLCGEPLYINNKQEEQQNANDDENAVVEIEYNDGEIERISIEENTEKNTTDEE